MQAVKIADTWHLSGDKIGSILSFLGYNQCIGCTILYAGHHFLTQQELIRRWDSERELFNDDIAQVGPTSKYRKREPTSFNKLDDS